MEYTSHTDESRRDVLAAIGVDRFEDLLKAIPDAIRLHRPIDLPPGLSEFEVDSLLDGIIYAAVFYIFSSIMDGNQGRRTGGI